MRTVSVSTDKSTETYNQYKCKEKHTFCSKNNQRRKH
jgi:hypothetical protein